VTAVADGATILSAPPPRRVASRRGPRHRRDRRLLVASYGKVSRVSKSGATAETLAYPPGTSATCVAIDATYVYWLDAYSFQPLWRVPK
jgi:hypothetical protein